MAGHTLAEWPRERTSPQRAWKATRRREREFAVASFERGKSRSPHRSPSTLRMGRRRRVVPRNAARPGVRGAAELEGWARGVRRDAPCPAPPQLRDLSHRPRGWWWPRPGGGRGLDAGGHGRGQVCDRVVTAAPLRTCPEIADRTPSAARDSRLRNPGTGAPHRRPHFPEREHEPLLWKHFRFSPDATRPARACAFVAGRGAGGQRAASRGSWPARFLRRGDTLRRADRGSCPRTPRVSSRDRKVPTQSQAAARSGLTGRVLRGDGASPRRRSAPLLTQPRVTLLPPRCTHEAGDVAGGRGARGERLGPLRWPV